MRIFLNIWAAVGPLLGVALGGWLTMKNQRRLWILDNKRAEYRKLMSTLTRTYTMLMYVYSDTARTGKDELKCKNMRLAALNVMRDRIFIAKEVAKMGISIKWSKAVGELNVGCNLTPLDKAYHEIAESIRESAAKIM